MQDPNVQMYLLSVLAYVMSMKIHYINVSTSFVVLIGQTHKMEYTQAETEHLTEFTTT